MNKTVRCIVIFLWLLFFLPWITPAIAADATPSASAAASASPVSSPQASASPSSSPVVTTAAAATSPKPSSSLQKEEVLGAATVLGATGVEEWIPWACAGVIGIIVIAGGMKVARSHVEE